MAPPVTPPEVRILKYIDFDGPVSDYRPDLGKCHIWIGAKSTYPDGQQYGRFRGHNSKMYPPHRFMYELVYGSTDADAIDHLCRVTLCVNPDHLEPTTDRENILRGNGWAAKNAAKTGCGKEGHGDYDYFSAGKRYCSMCMEESRRRRGHKKQQVIYYHVDGKQYRLSELSSIYGIHYQTLYSRIKTGKSIEEALGIDDESK
jgi:hypothetical protein